MNTLNIEAAKEQVLGVNESLDFIEESEEYTIDSLSLVEQLNDVQSTLDLMCKYEMDESGIIDAQLVEMALIEEIMLEDDAAAAAAPAAGGAAPAKGGGFFSAISGFFKAVFRVMGQGDEKNKGEVQNANQQIDAKLNESGAGGDAGTPPPPSEAELAKQKEIDALQQQLASADEAAKAAAQQQLAAKQAEIAKMKQARKQEIAATGGYTGLFMRKLKTGFGLFEKKVSTGDILMQDAKGIASSIGGWLGGFIGKKDVEVDPTFKTKLTTALKSLSGFTKKRINAISNVIGNVINNDVKAPVPTDAGEANTKGDEAVANLTKAGEVVDGLTNNVKSGLDMVKGLFSTASKYVKQAAGAVVDTAKGGFKDKLKAGVNAAKGKMASGVNAVKGKLGGGAAPAPATPAPAAPAAAPTPPPTA